VALIRRHMRERIGEIAALYRANLKSAFISS
jgi:hypothetical protein